jgi:hypothetical protein
MSTKSPTLAEHRTADDWLHLRCMLCDRDKIISMWEACHRYGHDLTVPEVRAVITARCKIKPCQAMIGTALDHLKPFRPS